MKRHRISHEHALCLPRAVRLCGLPLRPMIAAPRLRRTAAIEGAPGPCGGPRARARRLTVGRVSLDTAYKTVKPTLAALQPAAAVDHHLVAIEEIRLPEVVGAGSAASASTSASESMGNMAATGCTV